MKRRKTKDDDLRRVHMHTIAFNQKEINAIENYCKKYKVKNKSKFMREAIIKQILQRLEEDHPVLFDVGRPNLFSG